MSDDDLGYSRKEDEDRTLYLRRTGFGRAGRDILSSRGAVGGGAIDPMRSSSDREERGGLIAPRFGAQGAPATMMDHRGGLDDSMDDLDEQNFGDSFDSPPRGSGRDHDRDDAGRGDGRGPSAGTKQAEPVVQKTVLSRQN